MFLFFLYFSVFAFANDYKNCELSDDRFACMKTHNDIRGNAITGIDKEEAVAKTLKLCSEYRKCAERMKCKARDVAIRWIDKLLILCEAIDLLESWAVAVCEAKMETNRSTCNVEIYRTFPTIIHNFMQHIQKNFGIRNNILC